MYNLNHIVNFTNKTLSIGDRRYVVDEQLRQTFDSKLYQIHVLTLANDLETWDPVMIKIRYDVDPEVFNTNESGYLRKAADKDFYDEVKTVLALQEVGHGPEYIGHVTFEAGPLFPYPEGRVGFLVTSRVPGEPVDGLLSDEQIEKIHEQIEFAINHLRSIGIHLEVKEDPNCLRYDIEDDKLYLIDLIRIPPKINPADHMWELAIDGWHYEQSAAFSGCRGIDYEFPDWAKKSGRQAKFGRLDSVLSY